ncbi:hypothetical protein [Zymobacter sp. IVIA_12111.31 C1]|uniref:hypothetical protein n=1 Tax=Zymobacter sp. IVIA_12111.31 C1 TaxID=3394854 RepID=UPI0039C46337
MASLKGGDALKRRLANIAKRLDGAQELRVGFLEGAAYPDGTPVATVAATNEFGRPDKGQPPRPFFRTMIDENSPNWGRQIGKLLKANGGDSAAALDAMGSVIKGQLQRSINQFTSPPLAPSTVAAKGFDKPLIDTAHMLRSVDYEVVGNGGNDESA